MAKINENYGKLTESYLFSNIAHRVSTYQKENPAADIIRLGIGDVTLPLCPAVIEAMHQAVDEMGNKIPFTVTAPSKVTRF